MKKTYIIPQNVKIDLQGEQIMVTTSNVGLDDNASVGNEKPTDDNDENFFTKSENLWDEEW